MTTYKVGLFPESWQQQQLYPDVIPDCSHTDNSSTALQQRDMN